MLYWLIQFSDRISVLNVFRYLTVRTGGAATTAFFFVFLFGPWIIDHLRLRQGKGQPIRQDGPASHLIAKRGTPTMGGLMILSGVTVATVLWANPVNPYVWIVLGVTLSFGLVGFYDDYLKVTKQTHAGISGRTRLALEAAIALAACYAIARVGRVPFSTSLALPFIKEWVFDLGWFYLVFGTFIIVGAGNAVNLTDGLDGLAIGPVMTSALSFGLITYFVGNAVYSDYLQVNFVIGSGEIAVLLGAVLGQASASCGSTRHPPRSSWAIPARSRSAGCSAPSRSPPSTRSCSASSAASSSWKRSPSSCKWCRSSSPENACS